MARKVTDSHTGLGVFHPEAQSGLYLFNKQREQFFNIDTNVVIDGLAVDGRIAKVAGEQDGT